MRREDVTEVVPGIFKIRLAMPIDMDHVNVYLLDDDPLTLIDTGPIMHGVEGELHAAFKMAGHDASELGRILITHTHQDHMGLAARLQEASGAEVVAHHAAVERLADYHGFGRKGVDFLMEAGPSLGLPREMLEGSRGEMDGWQETADPVAVDRPVGEGDLLPAGRFPLRVHHTPGHTLDHVVFFQEEAGLLFSGDFLLEEITPNPDVYLPESTDKVSGLPDYIESLKRLRGLEVLQVLPGHGRCISDFGGRIDEVLLHHDQRMLYVAANLRGREMNVLEQALDLLTYIEAEPNALNVFLAVREILGHLVLLEEEGVVAREERDGVFYFRLI